MQACRLRGLGPLGGRPMALDWNKRGLVVKLYNEKQQKLESMRSDWERFDIVKRFVDAHHFSSCKFRTDHSRGSLKGFYEHCKDKEIQDENTQTLCRALKAASLVESGQDLDSALKSAWEEFPICTQ